MCDPIGFILSDSEIYYDLHHNVIKTLFDGLEQFQLYPLRVIDYPNDTR